MTTGGAAIKITFEGKVSFTLAKPRGLAFFYVTIKEIKVNGKLKQTMNPKSIPHSGSLRRFQFGLRLL